MIEKLFCIIFPFLEMIGANKKMLAKAKEIESGKNMEQNICYMKCYEKLPFVEVEKFYEKTLNVKKSLEEKLRVSLFSVTVGITLLTSMIGFLYQDGFSELNKYIRAATFFSAGSSITYMIFAAVFAIKTISGKIIVYQLFPEDIANASNEDEKKEQLAVCAELNSIMNIIRQNLMSVSYRCIVNSLVLVAILFFTLGISSFYINHKNNGVEEIKNELSNSKQNLSSIQSDLSTFKTSVVDNQSTISASIQKINSVVFDTINNNKRIEIDVMKAQKEIVTIKNKLNKISNKANAADAENRAVD